MRASLSLVLLVHLFVHHSCRLGSARLAQIQPIAPVYSRKSGDRRTTPSLDSVCAPPSTCRAISAVQSIA